MARVEINPTFAEQVQRWAERDLKFRADYMLDEAKNFCPVKSGRLRDSITAEKITDGWRVGSNVPYSGFVEYGTIKVGPVAYLRRAMARMITKFAQ